MRSRVLFAVVSSFIVTVGCSSSLPNDGSLTKVLTPHEGADEIVADNHDGLYMTFAAKSGLNGLSHFDGSKWTDVSTDGLTVAWRYLAVGPDDALYVIAQPILGAMPPPAVLMRLPPNGTKWETFTPSLSVQGRPRAASDGTLYVLAGGHIFFRGPGEAAWTDAMPTAKNGLPIDAEVTQIVPDQQGNVWAFAGQSAVPSKVGYLKIHRDTLQGYPDPFANLTDSIHAMTHFIDAGGTHHAFSNGQVQHKGPVYTWQPPTAAAVTTTSAAPPEVSDGSCNAPLQNSVSTCEGPLAGSSGFTEQLIVVGDTVFQTWRDGTVEGEPSLLKFRAGANQWEYVRTLGAVDDNGGIRFMVTTGGTVYVKSVFFNGQYNPDTQIGTTGTFLQSFYRLDY